jgi:exonuclease VII small subunit
MEDAINNLDGRLRSVEQILPTLATKEDLRVMGNALDEIKSHADVRIEDARDDIRKVAEGVAAVATSLQGTSRVLDGVVTRLDRHEVVLEAVVERLDRHETLFERLAQRLDRHDVILEGVVQQLDGHGVILEMLVDRLDRHGTLLETLVKRGT